MTDDNLSPTAPSSSRTPRFSAGPPSSSISGDGIDGTESSAPILYPDVEPVRLSQEDIDDLYLRIYGHENPNSPRTIARAQQEAEAAQREYEAIKREQDEAQRKADEAYQKALHSPWTYILAAIAPLANILFFIPMFILTLLGLSQHPFIGYLFFRDLMRGR